MELGRPYKLASLYPEIQFLKIFQHTFFCFCFLNSRVLFYMVRPPRMAILLLSVHLLLDQCLLHLWWWWFSHYVMSDPCVLVGCSPPGSSVHRIFQE